MNGKLWMVVLVAMVGCGAPASDTSTPAEDAAPAGSDSKPAGEASVGEVGATLVSFNPDGAPVAEFEAPGMHCEMCAAKIVQVMKEKPGVVDVKADAGTKILSVAYSDDEFESDFAIEAVSEAGFGKATPVEGASEDTPAEEPTVEG
ncbi:Heavy-metal-associated domain protein [Planctomycetes bacterium MalM25]|nr:Heavy-metal-associated domain protein [Planctomycetes bacterium MalM25]